jgi:predicted Zn-dependent protease
MELNRELNAVRDSAAAAAERAAGLSAQTTLFIDSVNELVDTLVSRGYSQTQEFEADAYAVRLLALAGYDPAALVELLKALDQAQGAAQGSGGVFVGGFIKTHPAPAQRMIRAAETAGRYRVPDTRTYRRERFISE